MSNDKMRAEFEAWAKSIGRDINRYDDGEYGEIDTNADWFCWQASRAAIVVDLEPVMDAVAEALGNAYDCTRVWSAWGVGTMDQHDFQLVNDDPDRLTEIATAAIEAAGLKVKP